MFSSANVEINKNCIPNHCKKQNSLVFVRSLNGGHTLLRRTPLRENRFSTPIARHAEQLKRPGGKLGRGDRKLYGDNPDTPTNNGLSHRSRSRSRCSRCGSIGAFSLKSGKRLSLVPDFSSPPTPIQCIFSSARQVDFSSVRASS